MRIKVRWIRKTALVLVAVSWGINGGWSAKAEEDKPMELLEVDVQQPVIPVLLRKDVNPVLGIRITTKGSLNPLELEAVGVDLEGTTNPEDVAEVEVYLAEATPSSGNRNFGKRFGEAAKPGAKIRFYGRQTLSVGDNRLWVSVKMKEETDIDGRVGATLRRIKISGKVIEVEAGSSLDSQRIGIALRKHGDDGSKFYRIPALVRSKAGTLIAAFDIRYAHPGNLPADIDVGVMRSIDGGKTWGKMIVAQDMGNDPKHNYDGIGDPCIFVDEVTGRIWLASLWSHGNRSWHGSGPGLEPEETGQLILHYSDDDGKTWSDPINITKQVKDPAWNLIFQGPGTGITMKDGTLVFPAQYKDAEGMPFSTLIWSKDRGETWQIGSGVKPNTTEAQLVELASGGIMINCRDNRGGSRTVAITKDLGETWELHPTDRKALPESICQASLLRWDVPGVGPRLFFSNPATTSGRHSMTIKVSTDEGMSWPEKLHTLYDVRSGAGYSCLAPADDKHLAILYEGQSELFFLRIPVEELLKNHSSKLLEPSSRAISEN